MGRDGGGPAPADAAGRRLRTVVHGPPRRRRPLPGRRPHALRRLRSRRKMNVGLRTDRSAGGAVPGASSALSESGRGRGRRLGRACCPWRPAVRPLCEQVRDMVSISRTQPPGPLTSASTRRSTPLHPLSRAACAFATAGAVPSVQAAALSTRVPAPPVGVVPDTHRPGRGRWSRFRSGLFVEGVGHAVDPVAVHAVDAHAQHRAAARARAGASQAERVRRSEAVEQRGEAAGPVRRGGG